MFGFNFVCISDARAVRPYISSGTSFVYLGALLVYLYLVNLSTEKREKKWENWSLLSDLHFAEKCIIFVLGSGDGPVKGYFHSFFAILRPKNG